MCIKIRIYVRQKAHAEGGTRFGGKSRRLPTPDVDNRQLVIIISNDKPLKNKGLGATMKSIKIKHVSNKKENGEDTAEQNREKNICKDKYKHKQKTANIDAMLNCS